jgi:hypothetical protein
MLATTLDAGLPAFPNWNTESNLWFADYGISVATAGDVNGDGYSDVVIGARFLSNGQPAEGRAYVYLGSNIGLASGPDWLVESNQDSAYFGYSVATAGDVDDDGFDDVLVGAYEYTNGEEAEGAAFLYSGSPDQLSVTPAWSFEGNQPGAWTGISVATAGDVNGDRYSDVLVGAAAFDNGEASEGRALLFLGSKGGLGTTPAWSAEGHQSYAFFGISLGTAGDVNGDGYDDVLIGSALYDNGENNEGRAFLYLGSASGLSATPAWTAESNQAEARFGWSVGTAGDINGDGYADVIIGALEHDGNMMDEGRAFVFHGSATGLAPLPNWIAMGDQAGANFGYPVATAGDVNGDGFADVVIGAYLYDRGQTDEGAVFLYLGSATGLTGSAEWTADGNQSRCEFGLSTATAGDVNGDGVSDLVVGAPAHDNGQINEGRVVVYHGAVDVLGGETAPVPPAFYGLEPGRPNPFRTVTALRFGMQRAGSARLEIVNVAGQRVILLADGPLSAGLHVAHWNGVDAHGRQAGAGVYFARLTQPEGVTVQRLLWLR